MRGKLAVALAVVTLCLSLSGMRAETVVGNSGAQNIELAGVGDIDDNSFCRITTLNVLVGSIGITFCGWLLGKRKTS